MIRKAAILVLAAFALAVCVLWAGSWREPWTLVDAAQPIGGDGWDDALEGADGYLARLAVHHGGLAGEYRSRARITHLGNFPQWTWVYFRQRQPALFCDYPSGEEIVRGLTRFNSGIGRIWIANFRVPLLLPLLIFAAGPTVALVHGPLRRHRRRKRNCCLHCGYHLEGNISGICPECGEAA